MNNMTSQNISASVGDYLLSCREVNHFCLENGWIDNKSLIFEIQSFEEGQATVAVWFTEVITEGSSCLAQTRLRFGKLRLSLDGQGQILSASKVWSHLRSPGSIDLPGLWCIDKIVHPNFLRYHVGLKGRFGVLG